MARRPALPRGRRDDQRGDDAGRPALGWPRARSLARGARAAYQLEKRGGSSADERRFKKQGFCFFDQKPYRLSLPGASKARRIEKTTCNGRHRLAVDMGLSVGWNDPYQWTLPDQALPIIGLGDGIYRLTATADPDGWFRESNERNNSTWVDVKLTTSVDPPLAKVVRSAPTRTRPQLDPAEQHAAVVPAEAHRVRERDVEIDLARLVRDVVEVELGIGLSGS